MARTRRVKSMADGTVHYHLMSRTNDRRFLFDNGEIKTELVAALKRAAAFSGVTVRAGTAMDNHFHVVVTVVRGGEVPEGELIRRVGILRGEKRAEELAEHWRDLEKSGQGERLERERKLLRSRMNDISGFMKTFKEEFNRIYKRRRAYCGSIWSGRFMSTLVEDGEYLRRCIRYVMYNPIRAGIVSQIKDYAWSWQENGEETALCEGPVPTGRVAQVGMGKILGSEAFVVETAFALGHLWRVRSVTAHSVDGGVYSSHGWRWMVAG